MKKITFLLAAMVCAVVSVNAQDYTSFSEAIDAGVAVNTSNTASPSVITDTGNLRGGTTTYTTRAAWLAACDATTTLEDVGGGPGAGVIQGCDEAIDSSGGSCFAAGEIVDNLVVTIGAIGSGQTTVYAGSGAVGNPDDIIGSNTFTDFTVVNLTSGSDTSLFVNLYAQTSGGTVEVRLFGAGGPLDTYSVDVFSGGPVEFGFIAAEPVVSVEFEDLTGANAELLGLIEFGACSSLGVDDNALSQISIYPNPANDVINVKAPANIQIDSAVIYDVLGKATNAQVINGQINVAELARGVYILNLNTSAGTLTQKVVKQ